MKTKRVTTKAAKKQTSGARDVIGPMVRQFDGSGSRGVNYPKFNREAAVNFFRTWVYTASNIVANECSRFPLRLYTRQRDGMKSLYRTGNVPIARKAYLQGRAVVKPSAFICRKSSSLGDDFVEVTENHPVLDVLQSANDFSNGFDLTVLRFIFLQLTGNAYMHPVYDSISVNGPAQVWLLPSQWVEVKPSKTQLIGGYSFGADEMNKKHFASDEIIHFKLPNPASIYYGMGRVEAAWSALTLHVAKRDTDTANFQNRGRPDWLAVLKTATDQTQVDGFTAMMEQRITGRKKAGKFAAVTGDVDIKQLNFPPDIIGDCDRILDEISGVFGVPRAMLTGNMNVTGGGSEQGDHQFMRGTIAPLLSMDEQKLNESWLPLFDLGEDAVLAYDNPVPDDRAYELNRLEKLTGAAVLTSNEARVVDGLDPITDDPMADRLLYKGVPLGQQQQAGISLTMPSATGTGTPAVPPVPQAGNMETSQDNVLNGAQVTAATAIVIAVASGQIPRDAGIGQLEILFNLSNEQAERAMGTAGTNTPTTPNPNPAADAAQAHALDLAQTAPPVAAKPAVGQPAGKADKLAEAHKCECGAATGDCVNAAIPALINAGMETDAAVAAANTFCEGKDNEISTGGISANGQNASGQTQNAPGRIGGPAATDTDVGRFIDEIFGKAAPKDASGVDAVAGKGGDSLAEIESGVKADASQTVRDGEPIRLGQRLKSAIATVLAKHETKIMAMLDPGAKADKYTPEQLKQIEDELAKVGPDIAEAIRPMIEEIIAAGGVRGLAQIMDGIVAAGLKPPAFDQSSPAVVRAARSFTERLAGPLSQTTQDAVRGAVARGIEAGSSPSEIARAVSETGTFSPARAEAIARSESARAFGEGAIEAWEQSGIVEGKTFQLAVGACEICEAFAQEVEGQVFGLRQAFIPKGGVVKSMSGEVLLVNDYADVQSGNIHINCRCYLESVLIDPSKE